MSINAAGIHVLRAIGKHAELIMSAFESNQNVLSETTSNEKSVNELIRLRIATRDDSGSEVRLNSTIKNLLDHSLKTNRLRMVNADIGQAVEGVFLLAEQYFSAKKANYENDRLKYLHELQDNVSELCDSLLEQTRVIWRQVDSDFSVVALLSGKIALNKNAINKVENILSVIDLIDLSKMYQIGERDRELRRLLHVRLPKTIELCRQDLSDAINRLNKMLFKLNALVARRRLVQQFTDLWNVNPSYQPVNYADKIDLPQIFNRVRKIPLLGVADIQNPSQELQLSELLAGLRKNPLATEVQSVQRVSANIDEQVPTIIKLSKFKVAIREVFFNCLSNNQPINGLESYKMSPDGIDVDIWMYALIAEFNALNEDSRRLFSLEFNGKPDVIFTGNFKAENITLCPN